MRSDVAVFRTFNQVFYADTCRALKAAADAGALVRHSLTHGAYPGLPLPDGVLPEVRTVGYWDADHDQSWGLDWHRNEGIELGYVARGKLPFGVDRQHFLLQPGSLTITRPWQLHRIGMPNVTASQLHWVVLDVGVRRPNQPWRWPDWLVASEADIAYLTMSLSHNEQPVWLADREIAYYFAKLGEATATFGRGVGESQVRLYINGLLIALMQLLRRRQPTLDAYLSSTRRTVELFLASLPSRLEEPWNLATMATECGLGRSQFAYYCRELTNRSPANYLTACRIAAAKELLRHQSALTITEVAMRCGFSSSQYFTRVFHSHVGCSPREFRRRPDSPADQTSIIGTCDMMDRRRPREQSRPSH